MYFSTKSYLKSTRNHTAKHAFNQRGTNFCYHFRNAIAEPFYFIFLHVYFQFISSLSNKHKSLRIKSNSLSLVSTQPSL
jgi:hypothetical protein